MFAQTNNKEPTEPVLGAKAVELLYTQYTLLATRMDPHTQKPVKVSWVAAKAAGIVVKTRQR
jgi:hypothetical protein